MTFKYLSAIHESGELRTALPAFKNELKTMIKEGTLTDALLILVRKEIPYLKELLASDDPKIRQHAAGVIGAIGEQDDLSALIEAYKHEETLFNRAPLLKAMSSFDTGAYRDLFMESMNRIIGGQHDADTLKHCSEEIRELNSLIRTCDNSKGIPSHSFTGYDLINEAVLLTNRNHKAVTAASLAGIPHKEFTAGVMVKTKHIADVLRIRTFEELLFVPEGIRTCSSDPNKAAEQMTAAGIPGYISERLSDPDIPYCFRTELRTPDIKHKSDFEKRFAAAFEAATGYRFINSASDYELEIRFIEGSNSTLNILIRFCGLKDERFSYRRESLAVGMKPHLAALCCELARPYLHNNAAVCDPFCGSGILLVERDRLLPARLMYGIDIFGEAIRKASVNIGAAGLSSKTELITKDFFEFRHGHRFDEIITDMPYVTEQKSLRDIEALYRSFFAQLPVLLEDDNTIVIHTHNRNLVERFAPAAGYRIIATHEISRNECTYLFVLSYHKD